MAIQLPQGFDIRSAESIDKRLVLTKAEMLAQNDNIMPEAYFCLCKDDKKLYLYNKSATPNSVTGKYSLVDDQIFNNERFTTLETKVGDAEHGLVKDVTKIQGDVSTLQTNVTTLQSDVIELREDVTELDTRVEELKAEVEDPESGLAKRISVLEGRATAAEQRMTEIEARIAAIKLENIPGTLDGGVVS